MSSTTQFKFSNSVIIYPLLIVFLIWLVFWYQITIDYGIKSFGIRPQKIEGLLGIFTSPFLHGDVEHLYNNSLPLLVLTAALFYFYNRIAWKVIGYGILVSGFMTWCIAKYGNHIGASGLIYVLVSFIFFKGVFAKHFRLIALSLLVIFLYGSIIWYVLPIKAGVSWEGHLAGLITGFIFALIFRKQIAKPEYYVWETEAYNEEDDPFMKHFDENGNFIENIDKDQTETEENHLNVNYLYKEKDSTNVVEN